MHTCHAEVSIYICYHVYDAYHCSFIQWQCRDYPPLLQQQRIRKTVLLVDDRGAPGMEGAETKRQRAWPSCPCVWMRGMKPCAALAASVLSASCPSSATSAPASCPSKMRAASAASSASPCAASSGQDCREVLHAQQHGCLTTTRTSTSNAHNMSIN